jgi:hypothetical protein
VIRFDVLVVRGWADRVERPLLDVTHGRDRMPGTVPADMRPSVSLLNGKPAEIGADWLLLFRREGHRSGREVG